jgi:hypothetical protein
LIGFLWKSEAEEIIKETLNERIKNVQSFYLNTWTFWEWGWEQGLTPIDLPLYSKYDKLRGMKINYLTVKVLIDNIVESFNQNKENIESLHPYEENK